MRQLMDENETIKFNPNDHKDFRWNDNTEKYVNDVFSGVTISNALLEEIDKLLEPFKLELLVDINNIIEFKIVKR